MKKTKLKKRSKSKAMIDKADRSLQDAYRRRFKGEPCEVCGKPFDLMHHHLRKSQSNAGRYFYGSRKKRPVNLIFVCERCHTKISFGDMSLVAIYSLKRGKIWLEAIEALKKIKRAPFGKKELERLIEYYNSWKPKELQKELSPF